MTPETTQERKIEFFLNILAAVCLLATAVAVNPWSAAKFLALDGILAGSTQFSIVVFQLVCAITSGFFLFSGRIRYFAPCLQNCLSGAPES